MICDLLKRQAELFAAMRVAGVAGDCRLVEQLRMEHGIVTSEIDAVSSGSNARQLPLFRVDLSADWFDAMRGVVNGGSKRS